MQITPVERCRMSRIPLKRNELKTLAAIGHIPIIGKQVSRIAHFTRLTNPTASRSIRHLIDAIKLQFPIQINYPRMDLRLIRLVFSSPAHRSAQVLYIL